MILTLAFLPILAVDLGDVGRELSEAWGEGNPARNLRVRSESWLRVLADDEALGDLYFPNHLVPAGRGPRTRWVGRPQTHWIEDIAVRGGKYRSDYEFMNPDGTSAPRGSRSINFYNGEHSWSYEPDKRIAMQYVGGDVTTRLTLGYYLDIIGFPGEPLSALRTTAGDTNEPYRLDEIFETGEYQLQEDAVLDGYYCVVVDRAGLDRLWLARDHGWAIVRREWHWTIGGPLKRVIVNRDLRELAEDAWIPYECRMVIYGHPSTQPGRQVGILDVKVLEAEADVPEEWFEPQFPVGAVIHDMATGDRYPFGKEMETLEAAVIEAERFGPGFRRLPWWRRPWSWAVGIVVLLIGTAAISWRYLAR